MKKQAAIKLVEKAIKKSYDDFSKNSAWQPIISTRNQLNYILDTLKNKNDASKLKEIIIGVYAAREFESDHEDFANLIYEVVEIVDLIKKGKI